jgi:hypothetical protein
MERGRNSIEYKQFLANRFFRRYYDTIKIKAYCGDCETPLAIAASDYLEIYKDVVCPNCFYANYDEHGQRK